MVKANNILIILLSALLLITPLLMNQWGFIAEYSAKIIGVVMLLIIIFSESYKGKVAKAHWFFIILCASVALLYLIPLPQFLWEIIPGRENYVEVSQFAQGQSLHSLSVIPRLTENSITMLIPIFAVFLGTLSLHSKQLQKVIWLVFAVGAVQALIGLFQYFSGTGLPFLGIENLAKNATGTFVNRDHYAGFLELVLPLSLGVMIQSYNRPNHKNRLQLGSKIYSKQFFVLIALSFIVMFAIFYSRSRMGILLATFTVFLTMFMFAKNQNKWLKFLLATTFIAVVVAMMSLESIVDIAFRFFMKDISEENRFNIYASTLEGISALAPFGSGPGTFANVFKAFQPNDMQHFINSAHNDYLELIFETGVFGIIIILFFFVLYIQRWMKLDLITSWAHRFRYTQTAAGIGMLMLLIHGMIDFNFHVDANMLYFSFFAGLFFHFREKNPNGSYTKRSVTRNSKRRKSRSKKIKNPNVLEGELLSHIQN